VREHRQGRGPSLGRLNDGHCQYCSSPTHLQMPRMLAEGETVPSVTEWLGIIVVMLGVLIIGTYGTAVELQKLRKLAESFTLVGVEYELRQLVQKVQLISDTPEDRATRATMELERAKQKEAGLLERARRMERAAAAERRRRQEGKWWLPRIGAAFDVDLARIAEARDALQTEPEGVRRVIADAEKRRRDREEASV